MEELRDGDPRQIGSYALQGRLGSGGMGQVFLGRSLAGRLVAVKVIHPHLAADPEFRVKFAREADAARRISGIFTAPVIDVNADAPLPWLATGYVNGPSLATAVTAHGPLPASSVLTLAAGLAEGLGAAHAAGVVHRDLKPANVLLAADGPRLIDFGISQAAGLSQATRADVVIGTPGFMSPEQAEGLTVGPASDIFSLGAVLLYAATGTRMSLFAPHLDQLPGELRPFVERCLALDPARRPTASQFLAGLVAARPGAVGQSGWLPAGILPAGAVPPPAGAVPPPAGGPLAAEDFSPAPGKAAGSPSAAGRQPAAVAAAPPEDPFAPPPAPAILAAPVALPPPVALPAPTAFSEPATLTVSNMLAVQTTSSTVVFGPSKTLSERARLPWHFPAAGKTGITGTIGTTRTTGKKRLRIWLIAFVAFAVVVAGAVYIIHPWPYPVLRPTGLTAGQRAANSIDLTWSNPASGPLPDKYVILRDNTPAASVPGSVNHFADKGLSPATTYDYRVIAYRGGVRSQSSHNLWAATETPPLTAAVLDSLTLVNEKLSSGASEVTGQKDGDTWQDMWNLTSSCLTGPCKVTLTGAVNGSNFTAVLTPSPDGKYTYYSGQAPINNEYYCGSNQNNYANTTLNIDLTPTAARTVGTRWEATKFSGTLTWVIDYNPNGGCSAATLIIAFKS